jgi:5'-methylthioadenosine phosphorylase
VTTPLGIVGGSGFYELLDDATEHHLDTPFGRPSDAVTTGSLAGRPVAFVPRHGRGHRLPPHRVNYRANLWALRQVGVQRVLLPCAVGSLRPDLDPGTFVVLDQYVDRTTGRAGTFHDGAAPADHEVVGPVTHVSMADPYCPTLRRATVDELVAMGRPHERQGTIVVIAGPRFSTRAESRWFAAAGWDVVGMTQVPEAPLARELAMCVGGIAMVTDHDAGVEGAARPDGRPVEAVTSEQVLEVFAANVAHVRDLVGRIVSRVDAVPDDGCTCSAALDGATMA